MTITDGYNGTGTIASSGEFDVYELQAQAGETLTIDDGQQTRHVNVRRRPDTDDGTIPWEEHVVDLRWWTMDELRATDATLRPVELVDLVDRVLEFGAPQSPWDLGTFTPPAG